MFKHLIYTLLLGSALFLSSCGLETYQSGDLPPQKRLDAVKVGMAKEQIIRILGEPAVTNKVGGTDFFIYARIKKESQAFLEPKETARDVYVITFNQAGTVTAIDHLTLQDAKRVAYDSQTTPVGGKELSAFEQIVQNFGRYNAGGQDSTVRH